MRTAHEWYRKINSYANPEMMNGVERDWVEKMINEARKECLEEAIESIGSASPISCELLQDLINELK